MPQRVYIGAWYLVVFVATCAIGLAAEATLTATHGTLGKVGLTVAWVAAVVAWATVVFWFSGRLKRRPGAAT